MKKNKNNPITDWLDKYGDTKIRKQVDREAELIDKYIVGIDPYSEDSKGGGSLGVNNGELVEYLPAAEVLERYKEHLTEEQIKQLENYGN
ncbi:MAG: hypothetical protein CMH22_05740 [Methylophaga sp.]|nr:hypothetical protein [Methylophaga sp.]|tara:strand:+ start:93398 stop:93667 length:270 start_codon:yes stop_codon:yes gene_type:complete